MNANRSTAPLHIWLKRPRRVPFVEAAELNECGLACLASISAYYDGETGIEDLRRMAGSTARGSTLLEISRLGERIGLRCRAIRVGLNKLPRLRLPAVVHWEMQHFVVLERLTRHGCVVVDPAVGRLSLTSEEFARSYTGVALELEPTDAWQERSRRVSRQSITSLFGSIDVWKRDIVYLIGLSVLLELLVAVLPLQMRLSIDTALANRDEGLLLAIAAGFGLLLLLQSSLSAMRAWAVSVFGRRLSFDLMDRFVTSLHRKPPDYFAKHHTGDILSRSRSVYLVQSALSAGLMQALIDGAMSLVLLGAMLAISPMLGAITAGFALVAAMLGTGLRLSATETARRTLKAGVKVDTTFLENARAARSIRIFGKEGARIAVWRNRFIELTNHGLADDRLSIYAVQGTQLITGLATVTMIGVGVHLVMDHKLTIGSMIVVFMLRASVFERLGTSTGYLLQLRRIRTHVERIRDVLEVPQAAAAPTAAAFATIDPSLEDEALSIEVKDVWFRYSESSPWVLRGVSLHVNAGESLAITGPSGCGKTTLMNILTGQLSPTRGEVLVGGRRVEDLDAQSVASIMGVVLQNDTLFIGTIAENIAFFDLPVDMDRVVEAARSAAILADIQSLPMGFYTLLSEEAADISGGQRQRLFIARALYHRPRVLLMDEATSHLDTDNETQVSCAIRSMRMTRLLIAHRLETISSADRVVRLPSNHQDSSMASADQPVTQ